MPDRIRQAYQNTLEFTSHIKKTLPEARLNFVSDAVSKLGYTPSVFSLELPTSGESPEQKELKRRQLNKSLIAHMIKVNPQGCKHCVSYGQLNGSYWTIPATSTQGTTKEADKDYIVRISIGPIVDIAQLKISFTDFCKITDF